MKNYLKLLFVLFSTLLFSQKYTFDYFLTYHMNSDEQKKKFSHEHIICSNSKDSTYYATIHSDEYGTELMILDFKTKKKHIYSITKKKIDSTMKNLYTFVKTNDITSLKSDRFVFDFKEIAKNDSLETVELSIYNSPKRKYNHLVVQTKLKIMPFHVDLFSAFKYGFHPFEYEVLFTNPKKGIVLEAEEITQNTCTPNHVKLVSIAHDELTLIPPNQK